jgi:hypothetical protein
VVSSGGVALAGADELHLGGRESAARARGVEDLLEDVGRAGGVDPDPAGTRPAMGVAAATAGKHWEASLWAGVWWDISSLALEREMHLVPQLTTLFIPKTSVRNEEVTF